MSQFCAFFLSELGDGFSVLFFSDLLVLDTSPVNLDGFVEAFAFNTAFVDSWVVIAPLTIEVRWVVSGLHTVAVSLYKFLIVEGLCTFLDAIDITTCSLCNRFEGVGSVCPDLSRSLHMAFNCSTKSVSNNSVCFVC